MDMAFVAEAFTLILALILSLAFHEASHAYAAKFQGDRTAELEGRMTLNPIPHIDPMGTIFLPLTMILMGVPLLFGWAKPVPVNENNLRNRIWGMVIVAAAGPLSNLFLCFMCIVFVTAYRLYFSDFLPQGHLLFPVVLLIQKMILLNAFLAFFNLLPLPPLDGGRVFPAFLPKGLREGFEDYIAPYSAWILLALIISGGLSFLQPLAMGYVGIAQGVVQAFLN
jgi:Zn-dependent protease